MNLNQVTVPSLDLGISIPFYQKLGLKLIVHTHENYARFECPNGDATFSIHRVEKLNAENGVVIYFELDQLDDHVSLLKTKGIVFDFEPIDQPWLWREAGLKDPFGISIILFHAGSNRKNPPWRLEDEDQL